MSVYMDVVGVMAAYLPVVRVCTLSASLHCAVHTRTTGKYSCHNTDYVRIKGGDSTITVILAKHCKELPDDGSLVIRNMLKQF